MSTKLSSKDLLEFVKDTDNIEERLSNQSNAFKILIRNIICMKNDFLGSERKSREELFEIIVKNLLDLKFGALDLIDKNSELKKESMKIVDENSIIKDENAKMGEQIDVLNNQLNEIKKNYEIILNCNLMLIKSKSIKKVMSLVKKKLTIK
tara:strand:+ start:150 stop:602 length:453 start_codon:yes stop_codon:yes gene_type:complete